MKHLVCNSLVLMDRPHRARSKMCTVSAEALPTVQAAVAMPGPHGRLEASC